MVVAATAGALLAITAFSLLLSVSDAQRVTGPLDSMTRAPQLSVCSGRSNGGAPLQSSGKAVLAGRVQRIEMTYDRGMLTPDHVTVRPGLPLEIRIRSIQGARHDLSVEDVSIARDGSTGFTVPALEPGIYSFSCGRDYVDGVLVVRPDLPNVYP